MVTHFSPFLTKRILSISLQFFLLWFVHILNHCSLLLFPLSSQFHLNPWFIWLRLCSLSLSLSPFLSSLPCFYYYYFFVFLVLNLSLILFPLFSPPPSLPFISLLKPDTNVNKVQRVKTMHVFSFFFRWIGLNIFWLLPIPWKLDASMF